MSYVHEELAWATQCHSVYVCLKSPGHRNGGGGGVGGACYLRAHTTLHECLQKPFVHEMIKFLFMDNFISKLIGPTFVLDIPYM